MTNTNDEKILLLMEQIRTKKEKIAKARKFTAKTNLILDLDGVKTNLNVLDRNGLVYFITKLTCLHNAFATLEIEGELVISGYDVKDWLSDLTLKLENLSIKAEETKLKAMEDKLSQLLSVDKKIELELEEIMKSI